MKASKWNEVVRLLLAILLIIGAAFTLGELWRSHALLPWLSALSAALLVMASAFVIQFVLFQENQNEEVKTSLRAVEERFRDTFAQFPFSIQIINPQGYTIAVNDAWEKLFGGTLDDVRDVNLLEDEDLEARGITPYLRQGLAGEITFPPVMHHDRVANWAFSSHAEKVDLWIKGTLCPVKDSAGKVIELIIIHEDVTEQKLAREARHQSEARKSAIVEAALDCIISIDQEGRVIEWNPSAENTFGHAREAALGQLLAEIIIPPNLRERHAVGLKRYLSSGQGTIVGQKIETIALRANGSEFPVELAITPIIVGERQIFSAFLRDLTQAKAAEAALLKAHSKLEVRVAERTAELRAALDQLQSNYERLERLEDLRDSLTGMVVHDLRTPLNSMLFGVQTVNFLGPVNPAQQECLNVFTLGCKDSLGVINDLLDIGKMESGAFSLHLEDVEPYALVKQSLERIAMLADVKKLQLVAEIENDLPIIRADQEKMGRLLGNLLGNAIKFAPQSGIVTLGSNLSPDQKSIRFWVRDNGVGIPQEAFERIFEKFGQADNRLGERETSSGLGLAFCKMIVEAHHGNIWVESQPGQGSLFTAELPLQQEAFNARRVCEVQLLPSQ